MTSELDSIAGWSGWSPLDRQLANMLLRELHQDSVTLWLSVALSTWVVRQGDVCIDLAKWADRSLADVVASASRDGDEDFLAEVRLPRLSEWRALLETSGVLGHDAAGGPLVLRGNRLYLTRYFEHEVALAQRIHERLLPIENHRGSSEVDGLLERWFMGSHAQAKRAAAIAATRRWCVVTGGPGTGKTSTVVRLLGLLTDLAMLEERRTPRVLLLAPTGKAAARLSESIVQAKERLAHLSATILTLPTQAGTVHAALAACRRLPDGSRRPLTADVVILDEASMIDLAMMRRLLDACVNVERFVALGDPYQLASVEAGAVLAELCAAGSVAPSAAVPQSHATASSSIAEHWVELTESHRFRDDGGIGLLSKCIKEGDVAGAFAILDADDAAVEFIEIPRHSLEEIEEQLVQGNRGLWTAKDPKEGLARLDEFRVLCAHRKGRFGVTTWNERLSRRVRQLQNAAHQRHYIEPILVAENAPQVGLHNGDLGVVWREPGKARAWFRLSDGKPTEFGLSRLPRYEPAYVMSVHKSQGSEVDAAVVILPDADSALLTRELLYTAVTRTRIRCTLVGTRDAIARAVTRKVERNSGLAAALTERPKPSGNGGP